jgi:hypothetical protein
MNFVEIDKSKWPLKSHKSILNDAYKVLLNKDFIHAINPNIQYADFYIKRNKKNLFINIGESWTYGETLPLQIGPGNIGTSINVYDFGSQLLYTFGPKIACILDSDLYQYAVPGNANCNMLAQLESILEYFSNNNEYEKIYIAMQFTESNRDHPYSGQDYFQKSTLNGLYIPSTYTKTLSISDWTTIYYDKLSDWYDNILNKYKNLNINAIQWANFNTFETSRDNYSFKRIKESWMAYSARLESIPYIEPIVFNTGLFDFFEQCLKDIVIIDLDFANQQMKLISDSLDFIKDKSIYHHNHPNMLGHAVWATYLVRKANWADV